MLNWFRGELKEPHIYLVYRNVEMSLKIEIGSFQWGDK